MKSPAARGDMVAVYKKGRQLFWFYTSSGCDSWTDAACHVLGTSPSPSSSVEFTSPSGGEGVYVAVLWSGTYSAVVANAGRVLSPWENLAKYTPFLEGFGLTPQDVEGSLPGASYPISVPADSWVSQVGGVVAAAGMHPQIDACWANQLRFTIAPTHALPHSLGLKLCTASIHAREYATLNPKLLTASVRAWEYATLNPKLLTASVQAWEYATLNPKLLTPSVQAWEYAS
jgi:hypothetical protein